MRCRVWVAPSGRVVDGAIAEVEGAEPCPFEYGHAGPCRRPRRAVRLRAMPLAAAILAALLAGIVAPAFEEEEEERPEEEEAPPIGGLVCTLEHPCDGCRERDRRERDERRAA